MIMMWEEIFIVELLMHGALPDRDEPLTSSALSLAARNGNSDIVHLLLNAKANTNASRGGLGTPLQAATYGFLHSNNEDMIRSIFEHGAI
jgi:ankyrin repeat protein